MEDRDQGTNNLPVRLYVDPGGLKQSSRLTTDNGDLVLDGTYWPDGFEVHPPLERRAHFVDTLV